MKDRVPERRVDVRVGLNWTKVGLKAVAWTMDSSAEGSLNWTKVGLKVVIPVSFRSRTNSLNWTKVGLKGVGAIVSTASWAGFELD